MHSSKNNRDIGKTQLIEMEIDTGEKCATGSEPVYSAIEAL